MRYLLWLWLVALAAPVMAASEARLCRIALMKLDHPSAAFHQPGDITEFLASLPEDRRQEVEEFIFGDGKPYIMGFRATATGAEEVQTFLAQWATAVEVANHEAGLLELKNIESDQRYRDAKIIEHVTIDGAFVWGGALAVFSSLVPAVSSEINVGVPIAAGTLVSGLASTAYGFYRMRKKTGPEMERIVNERLALSRQLDLYPPEPLPRSSLPSELLLDMASSNQPQKDALMLLRRPEPGLSEKVVLSLIWRDDVPTVTVLTSN